MYHPASVVDVGVDVMRQAIWTTSWLNASQRQSRPSCTSLACRLPLLRVWTSNRRHQRRALCGAVECQHAMSNATAMLEALQAP